MLVADRRRSVVVEEEEQSLLDDVTFDDTDELRKLIMLLEAAATPDEKLAIAQKICEKFPDSPMAEFALENSATQADETTRVAILALLKNRG